MAGSEFVIFDLQVTVNPERVMHYSLLLPARGKIIIIMFKRVTYVHGYSQIVCFSQINQ